MPGFTRHQYAPKLWEKSGLQRRQSRQYAGGIGYGLASAAPQVTHSTRRTNSGSTVDNPARRDPVEPGEPFSGHSRRAPQRNGQGPGAGLPPIWRTSILTPFIPVPEPGFGHRQDCRCRTRMEVETVTDLQEIDVGSGQARPGADIRRMWPQLEKTWRANPWPPTAPGGEHYAEFRRRCLAALEAIAAPSRRRAAGGGNQPWRRHQGGADSPPGDSLADQGSAVLPSIAA